MKKPVFNFFLLVSIAPFLVQCASQTDLNELRYQLRIVNKKIEDVKATTVGQLQQRQAAASGQMDQLEQDIAQLKSQLEETYHLNQRLKEQNKELEATISSVAETEAAKRDEAMKQFEEAQREKEAKLTEALNEKLRVQQESVKAIQQARIMEAERKAKEAALAAQLAKTRSKSASSEMQSSISPSHIRLDQKKVKLSGAAETPPPAKIKAQATEKVVQPAAQPTESAQTETPAVKQAPVASQQKPAGPDQSSDNYAKAQRLYEGGKYKEALPLFEQVAANSSDSKSVDARFMMGESLFNQKEYDKAIMQYQNIISQHSDNARSPEAMLKQGMAFEKLADKDTAKVIYKKLIKKHGSSPEAATAQERLGKL
ncbi:tetratricopeptide repeat protein [Desulfopila sp. IMCC35006]|uniref:tetratricopeptide repeat protein n=1 Tax=Desulfopila sp. IMCC35006 TaxID=2569542 RepID=UPI00142EB920|nr:tetratricopeptide repeat protein [Desulfopila sp. IMCC35006]